MKKVLFFFISLFLVHKCNSNKVLRDEKHPKRLQTKNKVRIYVLAGQSNMEGHGEIDKTDDNYLKYIAKHGFGPEVHQEEPNDNTKMVI